MKYSIVTVLLMFSIFSCSKDKSSEIQKLKADVDLLMKSNTSLQKEMDSIETHFILPFNRYQEIVMKESQISPDSIIQRYESLINSYPNSLWSHEAKKRKNNVEERREYWRNGKWDFTKLDKTDLVIPDDAMIVCPGC